MAIRKMAEKIATLLLHVSFFSSLANGEDCASDGSSYTYSESLSGDSRVITMNVCPNHVWTKINPNDAVLGSFEMDIPAYPRYEASQTADLSEQGGAIGALFNGAYIFSAYGGSNYGKVESYDNSAPKAEGDTFDECNCHSSSDDRKSYHCHTPPSCLLNQLQEKSDAHSPLVGWAQDGFPVYGPRGNGGIMMKQCSFTGNVEPCVDECGGYYGDIDLEDGYVYRYYIMGEHSGGTSCATPEPYGESSADYFPFTPLCFKGCCPDGGPHPPIMFVGYALSCDSSYSVRCG
ncbi:hypothetical protein CYMTET_5785 [Cymbomonas tetramitiformis]|uniref:YHYH domain-containing protein n=1 Tax=Cymbomonas tetramitiformis TaxID=36881 RepID=A0AAE0LIQ5_9CHLO|nr:hypothetical protein CYMTET_5785 [Cymbomonas tetramitiformis]